MPAISWNIMLSEGGSWYLKETPVPRGGVTKASRHGFFRSPGFYGLDRKPPRQVAHPPYQTAVYRRCSPQFQPSFKGDNILPADNIMQGISIIRRDFAEEEDRLKGEKRIYFFLDVFSSWWINLHLLMHSQFSGRYFPSGPGFITALCFAPQTRHSISPLDSSTTFITCSFFVMLPKSIRVGDKTMECCIGSGFKKPLNNDWYAEFYKKIFSRVFLWMVTSCHTSNTYVITRSQNTNTGDTYKVRFTALYGFDVRVLHPQSYKDAPVSSTILYTPGYFVIC